MPHIPASSALSRFRVLDLTRVRAGPTCVKQFADFGADVIKIETPPEAERNDGMTGDRHGFDMQNLHRNKRSMTLNLKDPRGLAIFMKMVVGADVVVENYRPDVKNRLGVDYESLKKVNKGIVLASISGFGQDGPYATRPGFDQIAQGMGGLMSVTGFPGQGPVRAGIPVADLSAGLYCALGIMIALFERATTGKGQWVQTSLLQAQISMLDFQAVRWLMKRERPAQAGNDHPTIIPTGTFRCKDGYLNIGTSGQDIFDRLCRTIEAPELARNPAFATSVARSRNRTLLNASISGKLAEKTVSHWVELLNAAGVPAGPVLSIDQVFDDPQVQHLGMAKPVEHKTLGHIDLLGQGLELSDHVFAIRQGSPEAGEHSEAILREIGYDDAAIGELRSAGVI